MPPIYFGDNEITKTSLGDVTISKLIINSQEIAATYTTTTEAP